VRTVIAIVVGLVILGLFLLAARRPGASTRRERARRRHSSTIHDTGNRSGPRGPDIDNFADKPFRVRPQSAAAQTLTLLARQKRNDIRIFPVDREPTPDGRWHRTPWQSPLPGVPIVPGGCSASVLTALNRRHACHQSPSEIVIRSVTVPGSSLRSIMEIPASRIAFGRRLKLTRQNVLRTVR